MIDVVVDLLNIRIKLSTQSRDGEVLQGLISRGPRRVHASATLAALKASKRPLGSYVVVVDVCVMELQKVRANVLENANK